MPPPINFVAFNRETGRIKRGISDISATLNAHAGDQSDDFLDEKDLRKDYENAVEYLVQCQSLINNLEDQLATKDVRIAELEEKIVKMSLDLATTKAREDQLQHKLKTSFTSVASSITLCDSTALMSSSSQTLTSLIDSGRYRPVHTAGKQRGRLASHVSWSSDCIAKTSLTTTSTAKTSFGSIQNARQGCDLYESSTRRPLFNSSFGSFGQFLKKNCIWAELKHDSNAVVQVQLVPKRAKLNNLIRQNVKEEEEPQLQEEEVLSDEVNHKANHKEATTKHQQNPQQRRRLSSRSSLEGNGVIFPVSSFEVLKKGCTERSFNHRLTNEEWPEFH